MSKLTDKEAEALAAIEESRAEQMRREREEREENGVAEDDEGEKLK